MTSRCRRPIGHASISRRHVEVEPGLRVALADSGPINRIQHTGQSPKRRLERGLVFRIVGKQSERRSNERACLAQSRGNLLEAGQKLDILRAGHQQAERDSLRIPIGKLFVRRIWKQQFSPVRCEVREYRAFQRQLLCHLIAQQAAEASRGLG
jgi:hypothetical protein